MKRKPRHARSALLTGLLGYAVLQGLFALAVLYWVPYLRDPTREYRSHLLKTRLASRKDQPLLVLCLGSSRTANGVKTGDLERHLATELGRPVLAANCAVPGDGAVYNLIVLRRLLEDGVRPDLVVLEALPPLFNVNQPPPELQPERTPAQQFRRRELRVIEHYAGRKRPGYQRDWWLTWMAPGYHHRVPLLNRVAPGLLPFKDWIWEFKDLDETGWHRYPETEMVMRRREYAIQKNYQELSPGLSMFRLGGPSPEALQVSLQTCQKEKIPVVLLVMPEGPLFRSWYPADAWPQLQGFLEGVSERYGVPFINAREWMAESDLYDSHHLLPHGATAFTERLAGQLAPLLRGSSSTAPRRETARHAP